MKALFGWLFLGALVMGAPVAAQSPPRFGGPWRLGVTMGTSTFNGAAAATDESGTDLVFRPYRPTMAGIGISYGRERTRLEFSAKYGQPGIGFRAVPDNGSGSVSSGVLIIAEDAFHLASFTASAGTRLVRLRGGPALRASLGVTMDRWTAQGTPSRTRFGPQAGLTLEFALTSALFASIDGELGFVPGSPFLEEDLPEGFRLTSMWRRTIGAGLSLRL